MTDHRWLELTAPYALDAMTHEERAGFEAHLADCATCRAEVQAFREVGGLLVHAAPATAPAPALRGRVLAEARRVRPVAARQRRVLLPWLAVAASLVLALGLGYGYWRARADRAALAAEIAARDSTLAALLGPEVHVVSLATTGREPTARVFWNHQRKVFIVTAFDLPAAPAGRIYQLWAIAKGQAPISMGTFNTDAAGRATLVLPVDERVTRLGFIDLCGLTEEPMGGSPQPTETPRLLGSWRHTD
jgi:anti-sigma-K factor RskA